MIRNPFPHHYSRVPPSLQYPVPSADEVIPVIVARSAGGPRKGRDTVASALPQEASLVLVAELRRTGACVLLCWLLSSPLPFPFAPPPFVVQ